MPVNEPKTKAQLVALVNTYLPETGAPNIRAAELIDLNTQIINRVDGRILGTGTFFIANFTTYREIDVTLPGGGTYTDQYIVMVTPVGSSEYNAAYVPGAQTNRSYPYRANWTIASRTRFAFKVLMQPHTGSPNPCRFWWAAFSKVPL